jgi:uncharacterized protein YbjQ (UPF0145 family)
MILTTTPTVDGKRITHYLGVVTGEAVLGANLFRDLFAGMIVLSKSMVRTKSGGNRAVSPEFIIRGVIFHPSWVES